MSTITYSHTDVSARIALQNVSNLRYHVANTTFETASNLNAYGLGPTNYPVTWTPIDTASMTCFVTEYIKNIVRAERMDATPTSLNGINPADVLADLQTSLAF